MPIIPIAIKIIQTAFKYRKQIYAVASAQDRAIKGAFVGSRVSKAAQYGWRSGAAAGGLIGSYITNDTEDTPGNGISTQKPKQYPPGKSYQTRNRFTKRNYSRYSNKCKPYNKYRYTNNRRY